jgi:uncharacterized protein YerC
MPKISRNKLDDKAYQAILNQLHYAFARLGNDKEIADLMDNLFTQTERLMVAKRLAIAMLLEKGLTYPEISQILKVSSATISFVRNGVMKYNENYQKLIQALQKLRF